MQMAAIGIPSQLPTTTHQPRSGVIVSAKRKYPSSPVPVSVPVPVPVPRSASSSSASSAASLTWTGIDQDLSERKQNAHADPSRARDMDDSSHSTSAAVSASAAASASASSSASSSASPCSPIRDLSNPNPLHARLSRYALLEQKRSLRDRLPFITWVVFDKQEQAIQFISSYSAQQQHGQQNGHQDKEQQHHENGVDVGSRKNGLALFSYELPPRPGQKATGARRFIAASYQGK